MKNSIFTVGRPERRQMKMSVRSDDGGSVDSDFQDLNDVKYSTAEAAANGKLYESKKIRKIVRVLTVLAYLLSVSLAAIILSMYYLFLWDPKITSVGQAGGPMALPHPEPQRNISCLHLGNAFRISDITSKCGLIAVFECQSLYLAGRATLLIISDSV
jgi:hypothetical protein